MIVIVNYGMGNLGSVKNMFKRIGANATISADPDVIYKASKILLPGVGAFDTAMQKINEQDFIEVLNHKAKKEKVPVLGICLGMQLLTEGSDEGRLNGLGWIAGRAHKFNSSLQIRVPHMGWNAVIPQRSDKLIENLGDEPRFYFVHSYFVKCALPNHSLLKTTYGIEFDSALSCDNIYGAQFHPEKSHKYGMKLLENFAQL
jgi:imidazole glycerol-phosphate synthase subunit HisH